MHDDVENIGGGVAEDVNHLVDFRPLGWAFKCFEGPMIFFVATLLGVAMILFFR